MPVQLRQLAGGRFPYLRPSRRVAAGRMTCSSSSSSIVDGLLAAAAAGAVAVLHHGHVDAPRPPPLPLGLAGGALLLRGWDVEHVDLVRLASSAAGRIDTIAITGTGRRGVYVWGIRCAGSGVCGRLFFRLRAPPRVHVECGEHGGGGGLSCITCTALPFTSLGRQTNNGH